MEPNIGFEPTTYELQKDVALPPEALIRHISVAGEGFNLRSLGYEPNEMTNFSNPR